MKINQGFQIRSRKYGIDIVSWHGEMKRNNKMTWIWIPERDISCFQGSVFVWCSYNAKMNKLVIKEKGAMDV